MKKYLAKLLVIFILFTNVVPSTAFAAPLYNSVTAPPVPNDQPAPIITQPVAPLPTSPHKFSASASILALASNDGSGRSAHIRRGVSVQKLQRHDFKADEDITLTLDNPDQEKYKTKITDANGQELKVQLQESVQGDTTQLQVTPTNQFQPGKYKISVTDESGQITTQDFSWGVLALNPDKAIYQPNETADLAMAVLDDKGRMVCNAQVKLQVQNQALGIDETLSTDNKKITVNPECASHNFTLKPDYEAHYAFGGAGVYNLTLTAKTGNGSHTITDTIQVLHATPFIIQRKSATRIYPPNEYPMQFNITANRDFKGTITETVPATFTITPAKTNTSYDSMRTVYLNDNDPNGQLSKQVLGASTGGLVMPFDGTYPITQGFGTQLTDPTLQAFYSHYGLGGHDGIDFGLPMGTPLYAVDAGKVVWSGPGDYGTQVIIQHSWGKTYYGHMTKTSVEKDAEVQKGSLIGYSGMTGEATGPHLHFGMKPDNADMSNGYAGKVDPMPYLPIGGSGLGTRGLGLDSVLGASTSATASSNSAAPTAIPASSSATSHVPSPNSQTFTIEDSVSQASAEDQPQTLEKMKVIKWQVSMKKGDKINLSYNFKTPLVSPQFYLVGSLKFYDNGKASSPAFDEGRQWQIAADDIGTGWYHPAVNPNSGYEWQYRKKLTIDHTQLGVTPIAPSLDATSTSNAVANTTNWSHTTSSVQSNLLLVVTIASDAISITNATSVTYNGTALTRITGALQNCSVSCSSEIWYLKNPDPGTHTVNVSLAGSAVGINCGAVTYYNVDENNPFGTPVTNSGSSTSASVTVTSTNTNQVVIDSAAKSTSGTFTAGGGQTAISNNPVGASSRKAGAATSTGMSWTISSSQAWSEVGVAINGATLTDESNFPVLVSMTDTDLKNHIGNSTANDLVFTDSTGMTKLSHEIESYNATTGALVAWVKIPSLSSTTDTDIYMYYGNGSVAAQEDPANTWSNGYIAVYHLSEGSCGSGIYQSLANNFIGACVNTPTNITGQIGNAFSFSGTNYIDANSTSLSVKGLSSVTANAWVKPAANQNESIWAEPINANTNYRYQFALSTTGKAKIFGRAPDAASSATWVNTTVSTTLNAWNFAGCTYNATGDLAMCTLNTSANSTSSVLSSFDNTNPNISPRIANGPSNTDPFNGGIDELEISNVDRGTAWLTTVYNNQSAPGTFIPTIGTEETKIFATTNDRLMRHGKFWDNSSNNYGEQPFLF